MAWRLLNRRQVKKIIGFGLVGSLALLPSVIAVPNKVQVGYSNTAAVIVCMNVQEFVRLPAVPKDYQPPEGDREEEEAIRVARQDARIQDKIKELKARALLTDPEWRLWWRNQEGYGHRVFYVTFEQDGSGAPQYYAVVDLTEEADQDKVRQAGVEPTR